MKLNNYTILFALFLLFTSCIKEDHFGASEFANIKAISVSNQSGSAIINTEDASVTVEIPGGVELTNTVIQTLEVSSFATSSIAVGDTVDLNEPLTVTLVSENGTSTIWTINAFVATESPQLNNGNLNQWYQTPTEYFEPGESAATTIWATGNRGTQILDRLATIPEDLGNNNLAAKMITLSNGPLGSTFGTPISAGSLFTGSFNADNINPSDPAAATEFGIPFSGRPTILKFKYSYEPGDENKTQSGQLLDYGDAADVYVLLEVRLDGDIKRLATAWFRTDDLQADLVTVEIPFTYGQLDTTFPDYTQPENGLFVANDEVEFILPTHISFVASSSFDGANFAGAVDSTLIIDDIELVYE